ncbi:MAG: glycosyl hydrolase family 28-related protein [Bacteroidota bacterium]|jgi:hypothetical protein
MKPHFFLKPLLFASLFITAFHTASAQIPDSLRFDWHLAGLDSNYNAPTSVIDITAFGAIPDDGADDFSALQAAFVSAGSNGGIIQFPSGRFHFNSTVFVPSNCIIKGVSSDSTVFEFNLNNAQANSFNFSGNGATPFHNIIDTLNRGGRVVVLDSVAITSYSIGDRVEIRQLNGSWNTSPATWAEYSLGHVSTVDSISGNTLFLSNPLRFSIDTSLIPQIRVVNTIENAGLECFKLVRSDSLAVGVNFSVYAYLAYNVRIRGVEIFKSIGAHFIAESSAHVEVSGCYFHEAYGYTGSNTRGYGVVLGVHANLCKVENNVFRKLRHAMMVKQGANGNVFAYNYSIEPNRSEFPANYGADICIHGHYPFANLFEGNICQNIIVDQAWGPNGPYNAYFRNRAELYGFLISSGAVQSDKQTIVGNDITSTAFFQGQYSLNGIGHFQAANRVQGNVTPSGSNQLSESSLFLTQAPDYFLNLPWPAIGLPYPPAAMSIPAAIRYSSSNSKTVCGDPDTVLTYTQSQSQSYLEKVYYSQGAIVIETSKLSNLMILDVMDLSGRLLMSNELNMSGYSRFELEIPLSSGIYLIRLSDSTGRRVYKMNMID